MRAATLHDVALRAFRSPVSGLATMLAAIATELQASLVAAYLLPAEGHAEMVATGGPEAATLGPPGKTSASTRALLHDSTQETSDPCSEALRRETPWTNHRSVASLSILLGDGSACIVAAGGDKDISCSDLYSASAPIGLLAHLLVTQREAEAIRHQLRELRQDRSLLAAGIQHDLKTPLTSIYGMSQTLLTRDDRLDDETRKSLLEAMASQTQRLNRMISATLQKQAAGPDAPVRRSLTSLRPLTERVASAASAGRGGEVIVEAPDIAVMTDADRLERALLNLLDNALKYSPDHVPTHLIVELENDHVSITVADNGPGVNPEVLPGLFGAYERDPEHPESTGLGLHSVRSLAEQLDGRVGYSRHSGWTRFTITLPADHGSNAPPSSEEGSPE